MPVFQRHDPAVEQLRRVDPLPAEVVDQQAAAVALELQRGFADVATRVVADFEVVHRQLAADDDRRPANLDPPRSCVRRLEDAARRRPRSASWQAASNSLMNWPSSMSVRGIQMMLAEAEGDPLGERRLAVARRAVQEQPAPEFTAGPSRSSSSGSTLMPPNAAVSCSRRAASARIVWASTDMM